MKYITLIIGLLVVGCGKQEQTDTEKPVKELTAEEKVVGTYEYRDERTLKLVLLENGVLEGYKNGKIREGDHKWTIINGELHIAYNDGDIEVWRINKDRSINVIARTYKDEKRRDVPKEEQETFKKIK